MSDIAATIKEMIRQQLLTMHTCLVCRVLELHEDGTAKIQPLTLTQSTTGTVRQHAPLDGVPVLDQIRHTVTADAVCVAVFAERDISAVLTGEYALPSTAHHHSLSDGMIIGTLDGSGTSVPASWYAPLPAETDSAKTSIKAAEQGREVCVDVKLHAGEYNELACYEDGLSVEVAPITNLELEDMLT